jgi:transposase-like protein
MGSNRKAARRERRAFTAEFKAEAVRLVAARRAEGVTLAQVGRELEVRPDQLRARARLHRDADQRRGAGPAETLEQENRRLRREVATLRQEQAFARKVAVYFAKESRCGAP